LSLTQIITASAHSPQSVLISESPGEAHLASLLRLKSSELLRPSSTSAPTRESTQDQHLLSQCISCRYLKQTIVDDSTLLLLYGQCSVHETARAMAGLAGLDLCSRVMTPKTPPPRQESEEALTGKSLLIKYLTGVETKLQNHLKRLSACGDLSFFRHLSLSHTRYLTLFLSLSSPVEHEKSPVTALSELLTSSVEILQHTILEVYLLFLQPTVVSSPSSSSSTSTSSSLSGGLFGYHLRQFIHSLLPLHTHQQSPHQLPAHQIPTQIPSWDLLEQAIHDQVSPLIFLEVWFSWIRTQIDSIQTQAKDAFALLITSPAEVSKLQRLVSQTCLSTTFFNSTTFSSFSSSSSSGGHAHAHAPHLTHFSLSPNEGPTKLQTSSNSLSISVGVLSRSEIWYDSCVCLIETILTSRWNQIQNQFQHRLDHRALYGPSGGPFGGPSGSLSSIGNGETGGEGLTIASEAGGRMLWIYIFRQPFLTLVERLMKVSCREIFFTVKKSIFGILTDLSSVTHSSHLPQSQSSHSTTVGGAGVGSVAAVDTVASGGVGVGSSVVKVQLQIDESTLEMKFHSTEQKKKKKKQRGGQQSTPTMNTSGLDTDAFASSTELFLQAERVRLFLENQMTTLMHELLFTVRSSFSLCHSLSLLSERWRSKSHPRPRCLLLSPPLSPHSKR
jgi:hypothetical protein